MLGEKKRFAEKKFGLPKDQLIDQQYKCAERSTYRGLICKKQIFLLSAAAARHPKFGISVGGFFVGFSGGSAGFFSLFCHCFGILIVEVLDIVAVCRAFASAQKTPQKPALIFEKSADRRNENLCLRVGRHFSSVSGPRLLRRSTYSMFAECMQARIKRRQSLEKY